MGYNMGNNMMSSIVVGTAHALYGMLLLAGQETVVKWLNAVIDGAAVCSCRDDSSCSQ